MPAARRAICPNCCAARAWRPSRTAKAGLARSAARFAFLVAPQFVEQVPGIESGVVAVVEDDAHGVAADGFGADNSDILLAGHGRRFDAAMALVFGGRAFDAQQFERNIEGRAVIEGDVERVRFGVEGQRRWPWP